MSLRYLPGVIIAKIAKAQLEGLHQQHGSCCLGWQPRMAPGPCNGHEDIQFRSMSTLVTIDRNGFIQVVAGEYIQRLCEVPQDHPAFIHCGIAALSIKVDSFG